ncbi:tetratricopeptide repeat protein, partial [Saprospiraceae bacterium]|nr:tetratricopeptide repeat protein [Saprospiraceae bacterium]
ATIEWVGQLAPDWAQETIEGVNYKHLDCDGNGIIDNDDALAITLNYTPMNAPNPTTETSAPLIHIDFDQDTIYINPDTLSANIQVTAHLKIGNQVLPAENIYGLALYLGYSSDLVFEDSISVAYNDNSFFGSSDEVFWLPNNQYAEEQMDLGITRVDGNSVDGFGKIGEVVYIINSDIIDGRIDDGDAHFIVSVNGVKMIDSTGNILDINLENTPSTLVFTKVDNEPTATNSIELGQEIDLFPNPATDRVLISIPDLIGEYLEVFNNFGQTLFEQNINDTQIELNTRDWNPGIYFVKREYIEAIKITTKAANRYSYNGQKTQRIKALINLTEILLLADENYEAKKLATSILQLTSKEDTLAASAFHLLGRVEFNDAHFKEALNYFTKSLTIRKEKLPENHPEIARSLQSIGITQSQLGQIDLAFENINTALNINNIALGENHLATAENLGNLGTIYSIKGENNRATKTIQKAIDIFKKENNEKQNIVVELYFQLGNAFINKDNYDLGLMNTQRGLTILEGLKGTEHPSRAPFLNNIGKIKTKSGNYMQALDFYHQALDLVEFHKGALHPDLAESNNNIAAVLHARGELDSALVFYKIALRINEDVFDESHPKVAESWGNIGDIYFELEMYDQALAFYNNAFTKYQDTYQSGHIALSKVEQQIGKTFLKKGGLKIALKHFQNSLNANVPFQYEVFDILKNPPEDKALDKNLFLSTLTLKAQTQTKL